MRQAPFEVGNKVYVYGRVSTVEKVYANGNFKIAGVNVQWRQGGWKAGDGHDYARHYTTELAEEIATERAHNRLRVLLRDLGYNCNKARNLTREQAEALADQCAAMLAILNPGVPS